MGTDLDAPADDDAIDLRSSALDDTEPDGTDDGADQMGPRLARALADKQRRRRRRTLTLVALVLIVAALAGGGALAWRALDDDDEPAAEVGTLVAQDGEPIAEAPEADSDATDAPVEAPTTAPELAATPRWPSVTGGRPSQFGGQNAAPPADAGDLADGFYLWQDFDGWHLWLVGGSDGDRATVTIDDAIARLDPTGGSPSVEQADNAFTLSRGGEGAEVTGVDFSTGFYAKTVIVTVEGDLPLHVGGRRSKVGDFYGIQKSIASR